MANDENLQPGKPAVRPEIMAIEDLPTRRQIFVTEYLITWNATKAARAAGYMHPSSEGWRLLRIPEIRAVIDREVQTRLMSSAEVLARLSDQARGLPPECFDPITGMVNMDKVRELNLTHLIKEVSIDYNRNKKTVKTESPQSALKIMAQHHKLVDQRLTVEHTHRVSVEYDDALDLMYGDPVIDAEVEVLDDGRMITSEQG